MVPGRDVSMRIDIDARRDPHQYVLRSAAEITERRQSFGIVASIEHDQAGIGSDRCPQIGLALCVAVDDQLAADKASMERRGDLSPRRAIGTHALLLQHP